MKRIIALVSMLVALSVMGNCTYADSLGFGTAIATSYYKWAVILGVPDIEQKSSFSEEDEYGMKTLQVDDIAVIYDNATLEASQAILFFNNDKDVSHQIMKANAFVAAIEYDESIAPEDWTISKAGAILEKTLPALQGLCSVLEEDHYKLLSGDYVRFYEGDIAEYVVGYDLECGYVIVAQ